MVGPTSGTNAAQFPRQLTWAASLAIMSPNRNVWRLEPARRVAVLVDGANYFQALRDVLLQAQHSILVVGWDIHSRTRLVGPSGTAQDGYPTELADFLSALATRRPGLINS